LRNSIPVTYCHERWESLSRANFAALAESEPANGAPGHRRNETFAAAAGDTHRVSAAKIGGSFPPE